MENLKIEIETSSHETIAFAQLLKRFSWSDARSNATSDDEAQMMINVICKIQRSLNEQGVFVR